MAMEICMSQLPPNDPRLVEAIVSQLKSKGIFDNFRKACLADVDTKPAFQNLRQRVDVQVKSYLETKIWKADLNKNHLRDGVRKNIQESGILDAGIDAIINQVVNPKIPQLILPCVEDTVYSFLNLEPPRRSNYDAQRTTFYVPRLEEDSIAYNAHGLADESEKSKADDTDLPMETDAISSEEDETLLQCSVDKSMQSDVSSVPEESAVAGSDDDATASLAMEKISLKSPVKDDISSNTTGSDSGPDDTSKQNGALLFDHHSLDSISSNSSGLSFTSQRSGTPLSDATRPAPDDSTLSSVLDEPSKSVESSTNVCTEEFPKSSSTPPPQENCFTDSPLSAVSQTSLADSTENTIPTDDSQDTAVSTSESTRPSTKEGDSTHSKSRHHSRSDKHRKDRHQSKSRRDDHYSHKSSYKKTHRKDDDSDKDRSRSKEPSYTTSSTHRSSKTSSSTTEDTKHRSHSSSHRSDKSSSSHKRSRRSSDYNDKRPSKRKAEDKGTSTISRHSVESSPNSSEASKGTGQTPKSYDDRTTTKTDKKLVALETDITLMGNLNRKTKDHISRHDYKSPKEPNNNNKSPPTTVIKKNGIVLATDVSRSNTLKRHRKIDKNILPKRRRLNGDIEKTNGRLVLCSFSSLKQEDPFGWHSDSDVEFEGFTPDDTRHNYKLNTFEGFPAEPVCLSAIAQKKLRKYLDSVVIGE